MRLGTDSEKLAALPTTERMQGSTYVGVGHTSDDIIFIAWLCLTAQPIPLGASHRSVEICNHHR